MKKRVPKTEKPLTVRDRKFIKGIMDGKTATQAMRDAGFSESTALARQSEKLGKLASTIQEIMAEQGIDDLSLMETLREGLSATKIISAMIVAKKDGGKNDADSLTKGFLEVPDFDVRHKFLTTGLRLRGHFREIEENKEGEGFILQIIGDNSENPPKTGEGH